MIFYIYRNQKKDQNQQLIDQTNKYCLCSLVYLIPPLLIPIMIF